MPGTLPVLNQQAVKLGLKAALALNCDINLESEFARKNYFYPDLPKGYQITQYEKPFSENGYLPIEIENEIRKISIKRIHLEEDAGKSSHHEAWQQTKNSYIDLNRCGVPLIEIVTEPEIRSPKEAYEFLITLKRILEYADVSDCNMQEGSLRCDANISLRPIGEKTLGINTELKNINSFRGVEKALEFEIERQRERLLSGKNVVHQTLLWDETQNRSIPMRSKEGEHDYRYFTEPDLPTLHISQERINRLNDELPELPHQKAKRFVSEYGIRAYDADVLTLEKPVAFYFEECVNLGANPQEAAKWITGDVLRVLNENEYTMDNLPLTPSHLVDILNLIENETISGKIGKKVFEEVLNSGESPEKIIHEKGWRQITDATLLRKNIQEIVKSNPELVSKYRAGKKKLFGYFMGQLMKQTNGKANPRLSNKILTEILENDSN
jgi:aspartyl-tRNA(Asn)/glutamyl-tRNA(Gln) amidotransferase subunit B